MKEKLLTQILHLCVSVILDSLLFHFEVSYQFAQRGGVGRKRGNETRLRQSITVHLWCLKYIMFSISVHLAVIFLSSSKPSYI